MYIPSILFLLLSLLAHHVSAIELEFEGPPIELGSVVVSAVYAAATFSQLIIACIYLFRARTGHRTPTAIAIPALIIVWFSHLLNVAVLVANYAVDVVTGGFVPPTILQSLITACGFFVGWSDPALFLFFFFLLRNRLRTCADPKASTSLLPLELIAYFLTFAMFGFATATEALQQAAYDFRNSFGLETPPDAISAFRNKVIIANDIFYTFVATYVLATILLAVYAGMVKSRVKKDSITKITIFGIIPFLILRSLARVTLLIILNRERSIASFNPDSYEFAYTLVLGLLYLIPLGVACHFWVRVGMWAKGGEGSMQSYYGQPMFQDLLQQPSPGAFAPFQGAPQQFQKGIQPVPQFPGQWGFTGQPGVVGWEGYGIGQQMYPQQQGYTARQQFPPMTQGQNSSSRHLPEKSDEAGDRNMGAPERPAEGVAAEQ